MVESKKKINSKETIFYHNTNDMTKYKFFNQISLRVQIFIVLQY